MEKTNRMLVFNPDAVRQLMRAKGIMTMTCVVRDSQRVPSNISMEITHSRRSTQSARSSVRYWDAGKATSLTGRDM